MTPPEKPKIGWRDRRRANREERKRQEADRAYRDLGGKGRLSRGNPPPAIRGGGDGGAGTGGGM